MNTTPLESVTTLTFDIFGTVLDLAGSLIPPLDDLLQNCHADMDGATLWREWRHRQRIEQYQDNLLMLGHSGYLAVKRRALLYCLRNNNVNFSIEQIDIFMEHGGIMLSTIWPVMFAGDPLFTFGADLTWAQGIRMLLLQFLPEVFFDWILVVYMTMVGVDWRLLWERYESPLIACSKLLAIMSGPPLFMMAAMARG